MVTEPKQFLRVWGLSEIKFWWKKNNMHIAQTLSLLSFSMAIILHCLSTWDLQIRCHCSYSVYCTSKLSIVSTVWCNQMGTVFAEMSSWTALAWYTVMKTAFKTKSMISESFEIFFMKILNFSSYYRKCL